jgi:hypothetical protein
MKILVKEPNKEFEVRTVRNELAALQAVVGGYIEAVHPTRPDLVMICNEEGLLKHLPVNRLLGYQFVGTVFFCGSKGDQFISLTPEDITYLKDQDRMTGLGV